ncbi:MAG: right-handed parallel beta-helix repeat-containing protein [Rikenellaceae bacterium]
MKKIVSIAIIIAASISQLVAAPAQLSSLIVVSADGAPGNSGTHASPVDFATAIKRASEQLKTDGLPAGGLKIELQGGVYPLLECYELGEEFAGTVSSPIIIQAAPGQDVCFDGRANVANPEEFKRVRSAEAKARLAKSAQDKILVKRIADPYIIKTLSDNLVVGLSFNDDLYMPSLYPNEGYAELSTTPVVDESFPPGVPKSKQGFGIRAACPPHQDPDHSMWWRGSLEDPRGAQAGISVGEELMGGTWEQWEAELARDNRRNDFSGYYEAIWKLSSMKIHSANAETKSIRLAEVFSYGFAWLKAQPFKVYGLLCEVDKPGEWYFDTKTNELYIYPVEKLTRDYRLGLPVADGFIRLKDTKHVHIICIDVQNVGKGAVYDILGGSYNLIAGAKISSSTATGVEIRGEHNGVRGCDLIDLNVHAVCRGGSRSAEDITPGHNYVENCHFYQKKFTHEKVNISITGVGNRFSNNLVHNSIGQVLIVNGNDQLIEKNEIFNVGYEEGDGGAVYSGADMAGYGNVYRHNFIHHLMRTPDKKYGRNGIYLDDHQSGGSCIGNILYKTCDIGVYLNSGGGSSSIGNIFLESLHGTFVRGNWGARALRIVNDIATNPNSNYAGLKEDFVGRVEAELGKEAWNREPWASKYPLFGKVMRESGELGRTWPIYCTIQNNIYYGNKHNTTSIDTFPEGLIAKVTLENDIQGDPSLFRNYDNMDFTLVRDVEGFEPIPFDKIGLYLDEYRKTMPNKSYYRTAIKRCFDGMNSYDPTPKRINTATLVEECIEPMTRF